MDLMNKCVKGTKIFVRDKQKVWICAEIIKDETEIVVKNEDDEIVVLKEKDEFYLRNLDMFDSSGLSAPADLTKLTHLHEASILHSLNVRFDIDEIYTFTGPILIAVNPFKMIKDLYSDNMLAKHVQPIQSKSPHIFSIANSAYLGMCKNNKSQTILISGESGAGKTESTKYVMKFLACAGSDIKKRSLIECQILESNPLLEAFGNAKTLRNDNSSRFGKYIELQFSLDSKGGGHYYTKGKLCGAMIRTYLLEKIRVCYQQEGERNYHIFYQLCRAAQRVSCANGQHGTVDTGLRTNSGRNSRNSPASGLRSSSGSRCSTVQDKEPLDETQVEAIATACEYHFPATERYKDPSMGAKPVKISLVNFKSHEHFRYLTKSSVYELNEVNELEMFETTVYAMQTIGISESEMHQIFNVLEGILYIGNVLFSNDESKEECDILEDSVDDLNKAASFLDVDPKELKDALCYRTIIANNEHYKKPVIANVANDVRDALARAIYGCLFLKVVERTNESVGFIKDINLFCGVLDIFGFESFPINSFEQLCINYTNECLQQFFNNFIFKCEEKLYIDEGIKWDPLDFPDNAESVHILESKPFGVFSMLDEECYIPSGKDKTFCSKIVSKHSTSSSNGREKRFEAVKTDPLSFIIVHFAGKVMYNSSGFLEKNKDQLSVDVQNILLQSKNEYISSLFHKHLRRNVEKKKFPTVSSEFREQLHQLMKRIKETEPHFIRCIKPNAQNMPDIFDRISVNEQLKYGGVLQAIKVSRSGYPVRLTHTDCVKDYSILLSRQDKQLFREYENKSCTQKAIFLLGKLQQCDEIKELVQSLKIMKKQMDDISHSGGLRCISNIGKDKKSSLHESPLLKSPHHEPLGKRSTNGELTSTYTDVIDPDETLIWAVGKSLCFFKSDAYNVLSTMRSDFREAQAVIIQKNYKRHIQCRLFNVMKCKAIILQRWIRRMLKVMKNERNRREAAKELICLHLYGYTVRKRFLFKKKCATVIQSYVRGYLTRKFYKEYRKYHYASIIKASWKAYKQKKHFENMKHCTKKIQLKWKGILARRQLKRLKEEAKEVGSLIEKNQSLIKEIENEKKKKADMENKLLKAFANVDKLTKRIDILETKNKHNEDVIKRLMEKLAQSSALSSGEKPNGEKPNECTRVKATNRKTEDDATVTHTKSVEIETLMNKIKKLEYENKEYLKKNNTLNDNYNKLLRLLSHFKEKNMTIPSNQEVGIYQSSLQQQNEVQDEWEDEDQGERQDERGGQHPNEKYIENGIEVGTPWYPRANRTVQGKNGKDVDILMCGPKNVGKTSLLEDLFVRLGDEINLNMLRKNKKKNCEESSVFLYDTYVISHKSIQIKICDCMYSSSRNAEEMLFNFIKNSVCIIVVFDSSNNDSIHPALHLLQEASLTNVKKRTKLYLLENIFNEKINMKPNMCDVSYALQVAKACSANYVKTLDIYDIVNDYAHGSKLNYSSFHGNTGNNLIGGISSIGRKTNHIQRNPNQHSYLYHNLGMQIMDDTSTDGYNNKRYVHSKEMHSKEGYTIDKFSCANKLHIPSEKNYLAEYSKGRRDGERDEDRDGERDKDRDGERDKDRDKVIEEGRKEVLTRFNKNRNIYSVVNSLKTLCGVYNKKNQHLQLLRESMPQNSYIYSNKKYNVELGKGLQPIYEITLKGNVPITYLLIGRDSIKKVHTLLAVGCKDGTIHIYKCLRTALENSNSSYYFYHDEGISSDHLQKGNVNLRMDDEMDSTASSYSPGGKTRVSSPPNIHLSEEMKKNSGSEHLWKEYMSSSSNENFNVTSAKFVTKLAGHRKAITCLVFTFTEEKIISSSIDRTIKIWEVSTGFLLKVFSDSSATLSVLLLPSNLNLFVCSNCTSLLRIVNVNNGHVNQKIKFESEIRTLEMDDTGLNIFAGSKNGTIYILELIYNERIEIKFKLLFSLSPITCIKFVPKYSAYTSPMIIVNSCDNHIGIIECMYGTKGVILTTLSVKHRIRINHALLPIRNCFSRFGGGWLISGSEDGNIYICSLFPQSNYKLIFLKHHKAPVMAVVVNDIDTLMISGDSKGNVVFWRRAFV
ncbi:myosin C [Plasmodium gonderi]|uniref:Myosin C n=1 Tax=Plasmodium gonderi TaxID=77519 RepID=A0A1Y1JPD7_PLAGO|nr:myosin C [Plasmodium gonderi]GAW82273.1 myosin C [Plasmodium gonderi]